MSNPLDRVALGDAAVRQRLDESLQRGVEQVRQDTMRRIRAWADRTVEQVRTLTERP